MKRITSQMPIDELKVSNREEILRLFHEFPGPNEDKLVNLNLFMRSGPLAKLLFLNEIYEEIRGIPGYILEFGVWLGNTSIAFENLRAVHEPYNHLRRIVGFDTFDGYVGYEKEDIQSEIFDQIISQKTYSAPDGYLDYLNSLMDAHEKENVMGHLKKHSFVVGDVSETCPKWFQGNPHVLVALAYFDMALEKPTSTALTSILPRLIPGSVIAFDELGHPDYPGETQAFLSILSKSVEFELKKSKFLSDRSYVVIKKVK